MSREEHERQVLDGDGQGRTTTTTYHPPKLRQPKPGNRKERRAAAAQQRKANKQLKIMEEDFKNLKSAFSRAKP